MKCLTASELIARLQELVQRHGDLRVVIDDSDTGWLLNIAAAVYPSDDTKHWRAIKDEFPAGWSAAVVLWGSYGDQARDTNDKSP